MSIWQFPDLRVQPGSHCGRPKWHYKSLKIFSKVSVSRKILCRNVCKSQNTMKPFFLNFPWIKNVFLLVPHIFLCFLTPEMSSDSRESLDHRDPPLFFESQYQSRYQDRDLKSLDSSLDIKTQDLRVLIPVSISRLKFQKSWFQS